MPDSEKNQKQLLAELEKAHALITELSSCSWGQSRTEKILQARFRLMKFSTGHSLEQLLIATLDEAELLTESRIGFLHFLNPDQETILLQAWSTQTTSHMCQAEGKGSHYDVALAGIWADCIRLGQPVIHNDYQSIADKKGLPEGHSPILRELVVPVFRQGLIVAILGIGNKAQDYDESDIESVSQLADLVWDLAERKRAEEALHKAHDELERRVEERTRDLQQANQELDREITERKRAEQAIRIGAERFREVVESTDTLVTQLDPVGRFLYVNPVARRFLGLEPEDCIGREALSFIHSADRKATKQALADWAEGRVRHATIENRLVSLCDEVRQMAWTVDLHYDPQGNVTVIDSIAHDVTERKRAEELLKENEERFRLLVELAPEAILLADADTHEVLIANKNAEALFATSREDLLENGVFRFYAAIQPDGKRIDESVDRNRQRVLAGEAVSVERAIRNAAGQELLCEVRLVRFLLSGRETVRSSWTDVTERRHAEQELARQKALLNSIIEGTTDAVFAKDLQGRYLLANTEVSRVVGKPVEEILGRDDSAQFPPAEAAEIMNHDRLVRESGQIMTYEEALTTRQGPVTYLCTKGPLRDEQGTVTGMFGISRDISERKRIEDALRESEDKYRVLFFDSPDAYLIIVNGVFVECNRAAETLLRGDRSQIVGKTPHELSPALQPDGSRSPDAAAIHINNAFTAGRDIFEWVHRRLDGTDISVEVSIVPMAYEGNHALFTAWRDITERKHMQEVLIQTEKMVSVGGLAAGMAHEINNPLAAILQSTQVALSHLTSGNQANTKAAAECGCTLESIQAYCAKRGTVRFLEAAREAGIRGARIVSNMLEFSRKAEPQHSITDINALLDKAVELAASDYDLKKKHDFKQIVIKRDYSPGLPAVRCSQTEIEQVVLNLLKNAAQAMGAKDCGQERPTITLRTSMNEKTLVLEIADNGPGMEESVRKRIFEPFFTTKPPGHGTGLGLSVSYFIITENHKGSIEVESAQGKGTRFIIKIPGS